MIRCNRSAHRELYIRADLVADGRPAASRLLYSADTDQPCIHQLTDILVNSRKAVPKAVCDFLLTNRFFAAEYQLINRVSRQSSSLCNGRFELFHKRLLFVKVFYKSNINRLYTVLSESATKELFAEQKNRKLYASGLIEVSAGFEPAHRSFADSCLTTWLRHHTYHIH